MGLGGRLGLGGTESSMWQQLWCTLEAGLSLAGQLLGTVPDQWSSTRAGARPSCLAGAEMEGIGSWEVH